MIELPEGAKPHRDGPNRVDVFLGLGDVATFGDKELRVWLVFRKYSTGWTVSHVTEGRQWETYRVDSEDVPELVKEMVSDD